MFRKKSKPEPEKVTEQVAAPAQAETAQIVTDPKIIAAITAAIVAVTERPAVNLVFTPIKRLGGAQLPWALASNMKIINTRQSFTEGGNR